jgi:hypothetical protein
LEKYSLKFGHFKINSYLCATKAIKQKEMDKNINVRVMGFPKENYDKDTLDKLSDRELSEWALADGDTAIFEDLKEFQEILNDKTDFSKEQVENSWWYFLTDLV